MSQGQGNHCCLFGRQSELWLAAHTQGASSLVRLPCSRICLALKAGSLILLVYLEGLRVQGWWTHANFTRNRGLNQNVNLLFSSKSCTFSRVLSSANQGFAFLGAYLWESQITEDICTVWSPWKEVEDNLHVCRPQAPHPVHHLDCSEGSSACHENSPACDRVGAPLPDCVFPEMGFFKKSFSLFFTVLCLCCSAGFSLAAVSGDCSSLRCRGFSLQWRLFLRSTGFRCAGFSSWSTWVQEVWFLGSGAPGQQLWYTGLVVPQPVKSSCNRYQTHVPCIGG